MTRLLFLISFMSIVISTSAWSNVCTCDVQVSHPTTGSQKMEPASMRQYALQSYDSLSPENQNECRESCLQKFRVDLPAEDMRTILVGLSQKLIEQGVVGFNCTGLTSFKYPVRLKVKLGGLSLGNAADQLEVVTHEQVCFAQEE